jgi:ABC-2 type transport system ATP-binding protein
MMENNTPVIQVEDLVKKFGSFVANDNISFEVYRGEIFGFLGANGAGKTTAIKILCGLSTPTSGKVRVAGFDVYRETDMIKKHIGYMSQRFTLYEDMTVAENIRFYAGIYGMSRKDIARKTAVLLARLGIAGLRDKLIRSLPLGWKQKLAFSIAIFHDPQIVFLDEPTGGVDPVTRRQFWEMIYETARSGITVFVTTHYMDEAEYCDRVSIMADGRIDALGTPGELKARYRAGNIGEVFVKIAR